MQAMEKILENLLSSNTETEILEFKEAKRQYDKNKLGKYFSALSNEANLKGKKCSWLLFGIKNDKSIVGTLISDKQLNEYKREIGNHTSPTINFTNTYRVSTKKGDVIMLEIPAAPKRMPISWKNFYYARDGESLTGLNIDKIERIRQQNISDDWSAKIVKEVKISDLSVEAIKKARKQYAEKNPKLKKILASWDDTTFLNKARVCINGMVTHTAILLLGKPELENFIKPGSATISWILKDQNNLEKDYDHFSCPLLLEVEKVYAKIRNLKYRYLPNESLFPDEVDQYDPYIIREAIHNCIAHQDYRLGGKINIVESEAGTLTFVNSGSFIPGNIEKVIESDAPETEYRNPFLIAAMVNLNMIDTIGSGIKKMFLLQKNKYFPLPDYDFSDNKVKVQIFGKIIDINYARKLAQFNELSLKDIILLDKVSKKKPLIATEIKELKKKKLIEGRKPNFYISSKIAKVTGEKASYIKQRGIEDEYCQKIILDYLKKFGEGKKADFEKVLMEKLPDILDVEQKRNKIKNNLQILRTKGIIEPNGKLWKIIKHK